METKVWQTLSNEAQLFGDSKCCSVIAFAACFDISFNQAHKVLAKYGRTKGNGVTLLQIMSAAASIGASIKSDALPREVGRAAKACMSGIKLRSRSNDAVMVLTSGHIAACTKKDGFIDFEKAGKKKIESIYVVNNIDPNLRKTLAGNPNNVAESVNKRRLQSQSLATKTSQPKSSKFSDMSNW